MLVDLGGSELTLATNEWSRLAATHHAAGRGRQVHARNGIMMRLGNLRKSTSKLCALLLYNAALIRLEVRLYAVMALYS